MYSSTAFAAKSFVAHSNWKLASVLHLIFHDNKCHYQSRHLKPQKVRAKVMYLKRPRKKKNIQNFPNALYFYLP